MKVATIRHNDEFAERFLRLPEKIRKKAAKTEKLFRENPFHPSLRLHKLQGKLEGLWSISVTKKYRIIFKPVAKSTVLFISIGTHAIYE